MAARQRAGAAAQAAFGRVGTANLGNGPETASGGPDSPSPAAGTPDGAPAAAGTAAPPLAAVPAATPPPAPAGVDEPLLRRWRRELGTTARAKAAADKRAIEATAEWVRLCTDARRAGVGERLLLAAAADADVDVPPPAAAGE